MKKYMLALALYAIATSSFAGPLMEAALKRKAEVSTACRAVLQENFQQFNSKSVEGMMATIHPRSAGSQSREKLAEFAEESQTLFDSATIYIHLKEFHLLSHNDSWAVAAVLQETYAEPGVSTEFRNRSALVPNAQYVMYKQQFLKSGDKWLVGAISSEPVPVHPDDVKQMNEKKANCKDGQCKPFTVRIKF